MERYLTNLGVWCWRYRENQRNYPGLHFTAKPDACDALKACVQQLRDEGAGAYRTIPLQVLRGSDEAKITGGQKFECYRRLRLTFHEPSEKLRQMSFRVEGDMACFDFVESYFAVFERGLTDVHNGPATTRSGLKRIAKRACVLENWIRSPSACGSGPASGTCGLWNQNDKRQFQNEFFQEQTS